MKDPEYIKFDDIKCNMDTAKAILVDIDGEPIWFPKSCIHEDSEVYKKGTEGNLIVTRSIAEDKDVEEQGEEYEE